MKKKEYGVFQYFGDALMDADYFDDKKKAVALAKRIEPTLETSEDYVEVWKRDKDGLYGNSGRPVWKSRKVK